MDTNPDMEVTSDAAVEAKLEAAFNKRYGSEEQDEPKRTERAESEEVEDETPDQTEEAEPEEELEELDLDGYALKLPKSKAEKLKAERLMQADYTRKTQEVAEQRRLIEERAQLLQQTDQIRQAQFEKTVEIKLIQDRLSQYENLDWHSLSQQDPARALALQADWQKTRQSLEAKQGEALQIAQYVNQMTAQRQQQMIAEGEKRLAEKIPQWGRELQASILENTRQYGYSDSELSQINDPRLVEVLHDAMQWKKFQASKGQLIEKRVSTAKPMPATAARGVQKSQQSVRDDDLRSRMQKTGKSADVESFLAARFAQAKRK